MCTRVVYSGSNGMVATGRSMDWKTDRTRWNGLPDTVA